MLLPNEREKLNSSRSQANAARTPTAISSFVVVVTAYSCFLTSDFVLRIFLCVAFATTLYIFFLNALDFFGAHFTVVKLVIKSKMNEKSFDRDLASYRKQEQEVAK